MKRAGQRGGGKQPEPERAIGEAANARGGRQFGRRDRNRRARESCALERKPERPGRELIDVHEVVRDRHAMGGQSRQPALFHQLRRPVRDFHSDDPTGLEESRKRGELAPIVRDGLDRAQRAGWIADDAPARLWSDWTQGRAHWSRAWGVSVLGHFLQTT